MSTSFRLQYKQVAFLRIFLFLFWESKCNFWIMNTMRPYYIDKGTCTCFLNIVLWWKFWMLHERYFCDINTYHIHWHCHGICIYTYLQIFTNTQVCYSSSFTSLRVVITHWLLSTWPRSSIDLSTARQNGVLTDQLCRAIYCIQLSIMPMQIAITITWSDNWSVML